MSSEIPQQPPLGRYYLTALAAAVAGLAAGTILSAVNGEPSAIELKTGVSIFAFLYIAAQGVERFVEMIVLFLEFVFAKRNNGKEFASTTKTRALASARMLRRRMSRPDVLARADSEEVATIHTDLANAEHVAHQARKAMLILTLGMSFGLSFVLLASVEVGLFGLVLSPRDNGAAVPLWVDWLLTAAALTGGSKGLHDLLSKVQSSKEADEAA
jgi:hypothetical protein